MNAESQTLSQALQKRRYLLAAAVIMLILGMAVYVLDREAASVYFLSPFWSLDLGTSVFGTFGGQLPEFVHVYSFILLTVIIFNITRRVVLSSCCFWLFIDTLFELGQHPVISPYIASRIPQWFSNVPFLENATSYFLYGTYDPWDLLAILLGGLATYGTGVLINLEE